MYTAQFGTVIAPDGALERWLASCRIAYGDSESNYLGLWFKTEEECYVWLASLGLTEVVKKTKCVDYMTETVRINP